ncbi:tyrosine-type recombinase/integrase [Pseudomonas argentinensis]|uniref:tyrosine-type recombinase/integrase n=1 Tax=Phytopseudomonas argentinensis TaxID=289370 RepID=UPI0008AA530A|nr:tyrosine-type recombinase/integrase [Pseudomonas argentinensis]
MRVPVYPSDLAPQKGFKQIAKRLTRDWSGLYPISLSKARELLARGFGYDDYHDVTMSAKVYSGDPYTPSESEVRDAIKYAINMAAQADPALHILPANLQQLVHSLPLTSLTALAPQSASTVTAQPESQPALIDDAGNNQTPATEAQSLEGASGSEMPTLISAEELRSIVRVVEESGNLRDMTLLVFMLSGLRSNEFLGIKASELALRQSEFSDQPPRIIAHIDLSKSGHPLQRKQILLAQSDALSMPGVSTVEAYINRNKIKRDDFLFPSSNDPARPMSARELRLICELWSVLAKLSTRKFSASNLRRSLNLHEVQMATGNTPHLPTFQYVKGTQHK